MLLSNRGVQTGKVMLCPGRVEPTTASCQYAYVEVTDLKELLWDHGVQTGKAMLCFGSVEGLQGTALPVSISRSHNSSLKTVTPYNAHRQ
eukprot:1133621-Pelagomonas_calceolata.AAC.6